MKTWSEKCRDPRWQKKRLKVMERDEFRCQLCWNDKMTLNVHHKYYKKGKAPWEYPMKALITLCEKHHKMISPKKIKTIEIKNTGTSEIVNENISEDGEERKEVRSSFFDRFR